MSNAPLSPSQKADARRLHELFKTKKQELGLTQEALAYEMGFSGQTVVSQYLTGRIPLNIRVAVQFARHLHVAVADFSEDLQRDIDELARYASGKDAAAPPRREAWPFPVPRAYYDKLTDEDKLRLNVMVDTFIRSFMQQEKPRKKSRRAA